MKDIIVQKFGGTSVADTEKIKNVARSVIKEKKLGNDVVVVGVDNIKNEIDIPLDFMSIGLDKEKIVNDGLKLLFKQINNNDFETQFIIEELFVVKEI